MSLETQTPRVVITGNGTRGPYSLVDATSQAIRFVSTSHVRLKRYSSTTDEVGDTLVENTDYTIGGTQDARTFTLSSGQAVLASTERIVADRNQSYTQDLSLSNGGSFGAVALMSRLDKYGEFLQELKAKVDRKLEAAALDSTPSTFPLKANALEGDLLGFDASKNLVPLTPADIGITSLLLGSGWSTVLGLPAAGILDNLSGVRFVTNIAALQALTVATGLADGAAYLVYGRTTAGDRGGGIFRRVSSDQSALVVASTVAVVSVNTGTDVITATSHGFVTGQGVIATAADAGLSLNTVYYVNRASANTLTLHTSMVAAIAGTSAVNITTLSGSLSLKSLYDPKQAIYVIATGDDLDGSDGVWVRDYAAEAYATWWGIDPLGVTDATEALNAFLFYMVLNGGEGVISNGIYLTTSKLVIDESLVTSDADLTRAWIRGEGDGNTHINSGHAGRCISHSGGASGGLGAYVKMSGFRLRGSGQTGGVGYWVDNVAWFHLEDVTITEFERGIDGTDVLSTTIDTCRIRFNYMGYRFAYSDASRPNAITLRDCIVGSNYTYGGLVTGAASLNIRGGSIEGNGQTAGTPTVGGYGVKVVDAGVEGGSGLVMDGVYCEGNADKADVWITHASGDVMHRISGCGFGRISSGYYVTNSILFERAGGSSEVWIGGNGFVALGSYAEAASRLYVAGPTGGIIDAGNFWQSDTAKPDTSIFKSSATEDVNYRYMRFEDDFIGDSLDGRWNAVLGSDPQCAITHSGSVRYGIVGLLSGDDAAASMAVNGVQLDLGAMQYRADHGELEIYFRIYLDAITTTAWFIGLTDQASALEMPATISGTTFTTNATDAVGILFDTDATTDNWKLVGVANNTDASHQDAGVAPVAGTYETWRIKVSTTGVATFFRNGAQIGTAMTGAVTPSVLLTPVAAGFSRTNAQRILAIDYIRVRSLRT